MSNPNYERTLARVEQNRLNIVTNKVRKLYREDLYGMNVRELSVYYLSTLKAHESELIRRAPEHHNMSRSIAMVRQYASGLTYEQVGKLHERSPQRVRQVVTKMISRLRKLHEQDLLKQSKVIATIVNNIATVEANGYDYDDLMLKFSQVKRI